MSPRLGAGALSLIVLVSGALAAAPSPTLAVEAAVPSEPSATQFDAATTTMHVVLQIRPDPPVAGEQELTVLVHPFGPELPAGARVTIETAAADSPGTTTRFELERVAPTEWRGEHAFFPTTGEWNVRVLVDHPDEPARFDWSLKVGSA